MKTTIKIHPAILVDTLKEFSYQIKRVETYCDHIDVDIIDWQRTKNKTLLVQEALSVADYIKMNFDLMMDYPLETTKLLVDDERVDTIIINISQQENFNEIADIIKEKNKKFGLSLNPENNVPEIKKYIDLLDHVQIYTVEPGRQKNPFLPAMLKKVDLIKELGFTGTIGIDGGVNEKTLDIVLKYPIDFISIGSELSQAKNPFEKYQRLINKIILSS